jgi:hypothetical protein
MSRLCSNSTEIVDSDYISSLVTDFVKRNSQHCMAAGGCDMGVVSGSGRFGAKAIGGIATGSGSSWLTTSGDRRTRRC